MTSHTVVSDPTIGPGSRATALHQGFFRLFGGPIAWFLQLCAGYAIVDQACWRAGDRAVPGTRAGLLGLALGAVMAALLAAWLSWRVHARARSTVAREGEEATIKRARFLSLWGVVLGGAFALATAVTAIAVIMLPRCAA